MRYLSSGSHLATPLLISQSEGSSGLEIAGTRPNFDWIR
jgi:hypothetical protein